MVSLSFPPHIAKSIFYGSSKSRLDVDKTRSMKYRGIRKAALFLYGEET